VNYVPTAVDEVGDVAPKHAAVSKVRIRQFTAAPIAEAVTQ
jgi:hypothetical protein